MDVSWEFALMHICLRSDSVEVASIAIIAGTSIQ